MKKFIALFLLLTVSTELFAGYDQYCEPNSIYAKIVTLQGFFPTPQIVSDKMEKKLQYFPKIRAKTVPMLEQMCAANLKNPDTASVNIEEIRKACIEALDEIPKAPTAYYDACDMGFQLGVAFETGMEVARVPWSPTVSTDSGNKSRGVASGPKERNFKFSKIKITER